MIKELYYCAVYLCVSMCIYYMDDNTRLDYIRGNGTGDLVDNFTLSTYT